MREASDPTPRGLFFSFEGIDGSGKSTQAHLLSQALTAMGYTVVTVREPGGTELGERVRALLLDPTSDITDRAEVLLFSAARAQLVDRIIEPALRAGSHVLADRYVDSMTAYQGGGRGLSGPLAELGSFATGGRMPDRTYFVDVAVDIAASRRSARPADRMEQPTDAFRRRVTDAYREIAKGSGQRVLTVDGSESRGLLHQTILSDATTLLGRS